MPVILVYFANEVNLIIDKLQKIENEKGELIQKLSSLEKNFSEKRSTTSKKLDKVNKLHEHEYDPDCEFCVKNPFVVDGSENITHSSSQSLNAVKYWSFVPLSPDVW